MQKKIEEQPIIFPPVPAVEALYEAASLGMMIKIRKQLDNIEQMDAKYVPFVKKVRELARAFEDEKIAALVEQHLTVASPSRVGMLHGT